MKIAVCDDNAAFAAQIEQALTECPGQDTECDVFSSADALLHYLERENRYDVYFMDIEMEGMNGIEAANRIRRQDSRAVIIFVTSHREYVYEVFEALPFRFLIKPVQQNRICTVLREAFEHLRTSRKLFFFKTERAIHQLPYEDILFFEGRGRKVLLHTKDGSLSFYGKISDVMEVLDSQIFCRIHASFIVNMEYIRSIDEKSVRMAGGEDLPISRTYRSEVRQKHLDFISWKSGV